ncbi:MAG: hypothetical protein IPH32_15620 [Bacteroidetes bacterium]|nr:hypothetical protein [Bacteroidota bacterium]
MDASSFIVSVASGLCAGVYSCVVTNSCATSVTKIITINPPPAISLTIGVSTPTVCAGNSTTLSATVSGGTPSYSLTGIRAQQLLIHCKSNYNSSSVGTLLLLVIRKDV